VDAGEDDGKSWSWWQERRRRQSLPAPAPPTRCVPPRNSRAHRSCGLSLLLSALEFWVRSWMPADRGSRTSSPPQPAAEGSGEEGERAIPQTLDLISQPDRHTGSLQDQESDGVMYTGRCRTASPILWVLSFL
jgi:hypothetical protein